MEIEEHLQVSLTRFVVIAEVKCKGAGAKQKDDDEYKGERR